MKIHKIILIILFLNTILASGGSIYSRFGLGDILHGYSARRIALGNPVTAVADADYISTTNPASWYKLVRTRFETGVNYYGMDITGNQGSAYYSETLFSGFVIGFPVSRDLGIGVTTGLIPVTNVNYEVVRSKSNEGVGSYSEVLQGDGGISKFFLGSSFKLPGDFVVGASFEYYSGNLDYFTSIEFNESSLKDADFRTNFRYKGIGTTLGLITSDISGLFGTESISDFRFSFSFTYISELNTDTSLNASTSFGELAFSEGSTKTKLPIKVGLGTSFRLNRDYMVFADYNYQPWSDFEFNNNKSQNLRDLHKITIGLEYRNLEGFLQQSFWKQIIFRGGLTYERTHYQFNGTGIDEYSVSTGFGLPLGLGSFVDLGFQYGVRGTTESNLLKENFYRASISLNIGELWFVRQVR